MALKCEKCGFIRVKTVTERDPNNVTFVKATWLECRKCGHITNYTVVNKISNPPEV